MKQKNDLFKELNINQRTGMFAVRLPLIYRQSNGMSTGHSIPHIQKGRLSL